MAARFENVAGQTWRFHPEPAPHAADRWRSVARARAVDEITREPVTSGIVITSPRPELCARVSADGIVGLVARPERVLPALAVTATEIRLSIAAAGYLPREVAGPLGPIAGFPFSFAPLDFGDVMIHRPGVTIAGRVVSNLTAPQPLPGATVAVDGIWSTLPPPNWTPPTLLEAPSLVSLHPGLYTERIAAANIARRNLTLAAAKTLVRPVSTGETRVRLSDRAGLAVGGLLVLDRDDPMRIEVIQIAQVDTTSSVDQPAWITLEFPVRQLHRDGVVCAGATPLAPLTPTTLLRAGIAGDPVAHLAAPPAFAAGAFVEIDDGVAVREFQRIDRFETTTDAAGFFRLPPISRIAFARLLVQHAGFVNAQPIITIDYRAAVQHVTVRME